MPVTAKTTWTDGLVSLLCLACLCVMLAAGSTSPVPAATGIVAGVQGVPLASNPGSAPSRQATGNVALLLGTQEFDGAIWYHLLASDGVHGWTPQNPGKPHEVNVVAAVSPLSLSSRSPDDADFESTSEVPVPSGASGRLIDASRGSRPASTRDLMVPERLSFSIAPWLHLKFEDSAGWAPINWVTLNWKTDAPTAGDVASVLRQDGFGGTTRRPFLGPVSQVIKRAVPALGTVVRRCESARGPFDRSTVSGEWNQPQTTILDAAHLLIEFAKDNSKMFTFVARDGQAASVWVQEGAPYVAHAQSIDLDNDGIPEWLLEIVSTYGDGFYSTLWIVKQSKADLQIDRVDLSHGSGEGQEPPKDATWWVDPDRKLWVVTVAKGTKAESFTYKGRLIRHQPKDSGKSLVVFSEDPDYNTAMVSWLKMSNHDNSAGLFPIRRSGATHWVVARPFELVADAKKWAIKHSIPASAVLPVRLEVSAK